MVCIKQPSNVLYPTGGIPYTPLEFFAHMDFAMKLYIVSISMLSLANSSMQ